MKQVCHLVLSTLLLSLFSTFATAQVIEEYDLGGASKPKPDLSFKKEGQYKRVHQSSLRFILRGELDKTEAFLESFLAKNPDDEETLYMLGILHGQRGNIAKAEEFMRKAIASGLPDDRLIAGPRAMMKPLADTELLKGLFKKYATLPVHGPLVGNATDRSASFWVRTAKESLVTVHVFDKKLLEKSSKRQPPLVSSGSSRSEAREDFTAVVNVKGLSSNTEYLYTVTLDDVPPANQKKFSFRTMPAEGQPGVVNFAFGGGAGYVPQNERMWNTIKRLEPGGLLLLGDNVYIDDPESVVMQQYTYHRRQSRPEWRGLTQSTPVFTIWDDHDFSTNDSWGGADMQVPFWKFDWVFPIFRQNWANPGYGGGDQQPGCWYSFKIADVDFIMLDCRYYRTNPKESPRSMLGKVQKNWLKNQLLNCKGTFKVICSSVPWDFRTKGNSLDTWNGYKEEHEEILSFIEEHKIEGVVLMSADRHRSDCWKISRPNGYDLYEFNSSRLTNQHVHPTMEKKGAIFSFNKPQSFGMVTFDTTKADPEATYEVYDINGEKPHSITIKRSQLKR